MCIVNCGWNYWVLYMWLHSSVKTNGENVSNSCVGENSCFPSGHPTDSGENDNLGGYMGSTTTSISSDAFAEWEDGEDPLLSRQDMSAVAMRCRVCILSDVSDFDTSGDPMRRTRAYYRPNELCGCFPLYDLYHGYNLVIATVAMMLSPLAYTYLPISVHDSNLDSISMNSRHLALLDYDCPDGGSDYNHSFPSQVLVLGLGGGELHSFLLKYYPCLGITSVELSSSVVSLAQKHFGLEVCDVVDVNHISISSLNIRNSTKSPASCRSRVIIGSAWESMARLVDLQNSGESESVIEFQYIVSDVYVMNEWDGDTGQGSSNVEKEGLKEIIRLSKLLLDPNLGEHTVVVLFSLSRL